MTIYFDEKYSKNKSETNIVSSYLKHLTIGELIDRAEIFHTINGLDDKSKMLRNDNCSNPFYINNTKDKLDTMPFIIRLTLNLEKMMDKETTLLDIKTKFISYWYKNYTNIKNLKKHEKEVISRISRCAILSNNATDKEQIIHIRFSMSSFNYNIITDFIKWNFECTRRH